MSDNQPIEGSDGEEFEYAEMDVSSDEEEAGTSSPKKKKLQKPKDMPEAVTYHASDEKSFDESAYKFYYKTQTQSPCLSFDIIQDKLGFDRATYPHTFYLVAGTQASGVQSNRILTLKVSNLHKISTESDDSDSDDEEQAVSKDPHVDIAIIQHKGSVNRVRTTQYKSLTLAASWSELGKVHIWELTKPLAAVDDREYMLKYIKHESIKDPLYSFNMHMSEGYAMDWSPLIEGRLATGDCTRNIHLWTPLGDGTWSVNQMPYLAHSASVEDIQWSPSEETVFASCSVDKTIRIWDCRAPTTKACMLTVEEAHNSDVNVISWSRREPYIVSGGDDGSIKVWDLRQMEGKAKPMISFEYHKEPITSVEWHPTENSVFAASSADNRLTQWDISAEVDQTSNVEMATDQPNDEAEDFPQQLLFVHQGQTEIKELHWHRQIPGAVISTALDGFDLFKTISV